VNKTNSTGLQAAPLQNTSFSSQELKSQIGSQPGLEYMGDTMTSLFKSRILSLHSEIMAQQNEDKASYSNVETRIADPIDRAIAITEQDRLLRGLNSHRANLQLIDGALSAIAKKEYGYCVSCGEEIGAQRLIINPLYIYDSGCSSIRSSGGLRYIA
jgi:DnaK suppressor protein